MLWGKKAHDKAKMINGEKHLVLCNVHPSPLAGTSFRTIKDFSKANEYLEKEGKQKINW
jgi:uracil-DNA glycosylase